MHVKLVQFTPLTVLYIYGLIESFLHPLPSNCLYPEIGLALQFPVIMN